MNPLLYLSPTGEATRVTRPKDWGDPNIRLCYDWLAANGVDEMLPEDPRICIDQDSGTISYTAFGWDGPRGWDAANIGITATHDVRTERRTVPLVVAPDEVAYDALVRNGVLMATTDRPTGNVVLDLTVGDHIRVGTLVLPVHADTTTCRHLDQVGGLVTVSTGDPLILIDAAHPACREDVDLPSYVDVAGSRYEVGTLTCCAECDPTGGPR